MRNMSFALTTPQFKARTKTVTRRLGWGFLKPGDLVQGCVKCMGLKPGEKIQKLGVIRIKSVKPVRLDTIGQNDVNDEGFPEMTCGQFITMFCKHMKVDNAKIVNRIEFEYL
jgi:hypothetical protein